MPVNNQKEYWSNLWRRAYENVPRKIIKKQCQRLNAGTAEEVIISWNYNIPTEDGKAPTLMLLLGRSKRSRNGVTKSNKRHWQRYCEEGTRPKDPEERRKLEILAGPHGNLLAYQKLKELCPKTIYEKPR